eukprot:jgi/Ulvmu1/8114/UM040_0009.1
MLIQVYKEPFCKRHFVPILSFSFFFRAIGYTLCILLAIIASFASGSMWMKRKMATSQADVQYQYKALAHFMDALQPQSPYSCSTDDITNRLLGARMGICQMFVTPEDYNSDGRVDHYRVEIGISNVEQVTSVDLTLEFLYKFNVAVDLELSGLVNIQHHSPVAGSEWHVRGALELQQRVALREGSNMTDLDISLFRHNASNAYQLGPGYGFDASALLQQEQVRNMTIWYKEASRQWKAGMGPFKAVIDIAIPAEQQILYRPNALSELRMSFVQWFSLSVVLIFLFSCFEGTLFRLRAFDTYVSLDSEGCTRKPF